MSTPLRTPYIERMAREMFKIDEGHSYTKERWEQNKERWVCIAKSACNFLFHPNQAMIEAGRRNPAPENEGEVIDNDRRSGSADCDVNAMYVQTKTELRFQAMLKVAMGEQ